VGNLAGTIIAVVAGLILLAVIYVQHELHGSASRPAPSMPPAPRGECGERAQRGG
jgi:hypothetical protein